MFFCNALLCDAADAEVLAAAQLADQRAVAVFVRADGSAEFGEGVVVGGGVRLVAGSAGLGFDLEVFGEDVHVLVLVAVGDVLRFQLPT